MITEELIARLYKVYREHPAVTTDSRNVPPGSVFFALRGDRFDGNRFVRQALEKGAAYVVLDDPQAAGIDGAGNRDGGYFIVDDALEALQALARHHRMQTDIPVLAITGTNGKTTTKELTTAVLSRKYRVHSTQGNLNNHIGVPLTLLSMPEDTEMAVVEMGASSPGEIAALCRIARPRYGIITNVGRAHLEGFGGEEGVRRAKGELYDWLASNGGTAVVREDDPVLHSMILERDGLGIKYYDSRFADGFVSALAGDYNRYNIASAVALGRIFGVAEDDIAAALAGYAPLNNRSQLMLTACNRVIADCYNANPSSMRAAIGNFFSERTPETTSGPLKKMLLLGDMNELGAWSSEEHRNILEFALSGDAGTVWLVGPRFAEAEREISPGHGKTVRVFGDVDGLLAFITENPVEGYFILLKGSRGIALEKALKLL